MAVYRIECCAEFSGYLDGHASMTNQVSEIESEKHRRTHRIGGFTVTDFRPFSLIA
jgi:hypothetical protein